MTRDNTAIARGALVERADALAARADALAASVDAAEAENATLRAQVAAVEALAVILEGHGDSVNADRIRRRLAAPPTDQHGDPGGASGHAVERCACGYRNRRP